MSMPKCTRFLMGITGGTFLLSSFIAAPLVNPQAATDQKRPPNHVVSNAVKADRLSPPQGRG